MLAASVFLLAYPDAAQSKDEPEVAGFSLLAVAKRPQLTKLFAGNNGWTGADSAYSIRLPANKGLWLFGDTFIGGVVAGCRRRSAMINNSVALQNLLEPNAPLQFYWPVRNKKAQSLFLPAAAADFAVSNSTFHESASRRWYWPGDGVLVQNKLYVFLHRIKSSSASQSAWGFACDGETLAVIENISAQPRHWKIAYVPLPATMHFGSASLVDGKFVYVYGTQQTLPKTGNKHAAILARIPLDSLTKLDFSAFEYYCRGDDGPRWLSKPENTLVLIEDGAAEMTVGKVPGLSGYFAVYTKSGLGRDIAVRRAARPEGPWSAPLIVYRCPEKSKDIFTYSAKGHSELATRNGELVITYCRNSESFKKNIQQADIYRPQALTVILQDKSEK